MEEEIERLIKISTLRDVEIALLKAKESGQIIPDTVFEIIQEVENN